MENQNSTPPEFSSNSAPLPNDIFHETSPKKSKKVYTVSIFIVSTFIVGIIVSIAINTNRFQSNITHHGQSMANNPSQIVTITPIKSQSKKLFTPTVIPSPSSNIKTYQNKKYGFSLDYPSAITLYTTDDGAQIPGEGFMDLCDSLRIDTATTDDIACLYYSPDHSNYNPNFSGAALTVSIQKDENTQTLCEQYGSNGYGNPIKREEINGIVFYTTTFGQGATGHEIESQLYQVFHKNNCYAINLNLESTSADAYPTEMPQSEKNSIFTLLRQVLNTLQFTN